MKSDRPVVHAICILLPVLVCLSPARVRTQDAQTVDLQLVLAVDTSSSVDTHEYKLQLSGIAAALHDQTVIAAIQSGPTGRIAVSLVLWSGPTQPKFATPWHLLSDGKSTAKFARLVATQPRVRAGGTGIGKAVQFCVDLFDDSGLTSVRRVIDLSGDGAETAWRDWSVSPRQARAYARARGVTVNGLAILTDDPTLDRYYRSEVIAGPDAFVLAVENLADFAAVMRRKLLREITDRPNVSHLAQ